MTFEHEAIRMSWTDVNSKEETQTVLGNETTQGNETTVDETARRSLGSSNLETSSLSNSSHSWTYLSESSERESTELENSSLEEIQQESSSGSGSTFGSRVMNMVSSWFSGNQGQDPQSEQEDQEMPIFTGDQMDMAQETLRKIKESSIDEKRDWRNSANGVVNDNDRDATGSSYDEEFFNKFRENVSKFTESFASDPNKEEIGADGTPEMSEEFFNRFKKVVDESTAQMAEFLASNPNKEELSADGTPLMSSELYNNFDSESAINMAKTLGSAVASGVVGKKFSSLPVFQNAAKKLTETIFINTYRQTIFSKLPGRTQAELNKLIGEIEILPSQRLFINRLNPEAKVNNLKEYNAFLKTVLENKPLNRDLYEKVLHEQKSIEKWWSNTSSSILKSFENMNNIQVRYFSQQASNIPASLAKHVAKDIKTEVARVETVLTGLVSDLVYETINAVTKSDLTKNAAEVQINQEYRQKMSDQLRQLEKELIDDSKIDEIMAPLYQQIEGLPVEMRESYQKLLSEFKESRITENQASRDFINKQLEKLKDAKTSSQCMDTAKEIGRQLILSTINAGFTYRLAKTLPLLENTSAVLKNICQMALLSTIAVPSTLLSVATSNKYDTVDLNQRLEAEMSDSKVYKEESQHEVLFQLILQPLISGGTTTAMKIFSESMEKSINEYIGKTAADIAPDTIDRLLKEIFGAKLGPEKLDKKTLEGMINDFRDKFQSRIIAPEREKIEHSLNEWMDQIKQMESNIQEKLIQNQEHHKDMESLD